MITKEELNAIGWKSGQAGPNVFFVYIGQYCHGLWLLENDQISMSKSKPPHLNDEKIEVIPLYDGECKDIEQFKSITNKLNLKWPSVDLSINLNSSSAQ